jgi:hypothetical protein
MMIGREEEVGGWGRVGGDDTIVGETSCTFDKGQCSGNGSVGSNSDSGSGGVMMEL